MNPTSPPIIEGVVIDQAGNTVFNPTRPGLRAQVRVYRGGWWLPLALGVGIPTLFVAGIFIFTLLMSVGLVVVLLRSLLGRVSGNLYPRS